MNIRQQLLLQAIAPLLLLSLCLTLFIGLHLKDRAVLATNTKAKSDLATGEAIVDLMYPGPWEEKQGILYKGDTQITNNFKAVDKIAALTGDTVTIFLGDIRVSTTVREKNGERAIGTKVSDIVAATVLKNGQQFLGEANVVGEFYQTAYKPIRDINGKIIGMFYVGISKTLYQEMVGNSLLIMVMISIGVTFLVTLAAFYFSNRVIIDPLQQITQGTKALASGRLSGKVEVNADNEIGELGSAFNQMLEELQNLSRQISKAATVTQEGSVTIPEETVRVLTINKPAANKADSEELPKGFNETTLKQILSFLKTKTEGLSAEEVGEGVSLTRVTARRYLEYLEKAGQVEVEVKYGMVGRPVKLYKSLSGT